MTNKSAAGIAGWLEGKSINQRLAVQMGVAVAASICLVSTVAIGSLVSFRMTARSASFSNQALHAALLEKDFTSLQRDVFRHGILHSEKSKADYEGNIGDLKTSIAETKTLLGSEKQGGIETVSTNADAYVSAVANALSDGLIDESGEATISAAGDTVDSSIEAIREPAVKAAAEIAIEQTRTEQIVMALTIAIAVITGFITLLLARVIKIAITKEIESISNAVSRIANGDLNVQIDYTDRDDSLGDLARAAVQLRETSRAKLQSDAEMVDMAEKVGQSLRKMAQGDLTVQLPQLGSGYATLRDDFNRTVIQLDDTMSSVNNAAQDIRSGAKEISHASGDLAQRTEQHAAELAHAAESVNQITLSLQESAQVAREANHGVLEAVSEARSGGEVVSKAVGAMSNIEKSSQEIGQIINVIDGIAFQTNLLALNAGVEAARAGDAGKGFAVVANEVRALAQRSADAAKDIKALITTSGAEVAEGALMVRQAGEALELITNRINGITEMVTQITTAATEQSARLADINSAMGKMDQVTQQNAAMVEESTAAARSLLQEADGLTERVGHFTCKSASQSTHRASAPVASAQAAPVRAKPARSAPLVRGNLAVAAQPSIEAEDWTEF